MDVVLVSVALVRYYWMARRGRACLLPIGAVGKRKVTTIEGLANNGNLHPVQQAWIDHDVPQCGYCQAGQIIAAVSLLNENKNPDDNLIKERMDNTGKSLLDFK